jgi:23S rRNA (guanosine2251-2'-O)-methyltransferase
MANDPPAKPEPGASTSRPARPKPKSCPGKPPHHRRPGGRPEAGASNPANTETLIFGLHAAAFALQNSARRITALYLTENAERRLADAVTPHQHLIQRVTPRDLDKRVGPDTVHQGALLDVEPLETDSLEALTTRARDTARPVLILDQVTDPHNVGAVLRSAAVFGTSGLVMTHRHSPPLGGALAKAASGALELTPITLVRNLAEAIAEIRAAGITVLGLDAESDTFIEAAIDATTRPFALALGAEGKGLRELTRQSCDILCRIGGDGPITSLNVSNAAAVALHLAAMRRRRRTSS